MATIDERSTLRSLERWRPSPANPFLGTWKLISCEACRPNGEIRPLYGPSPEGRLFYDSAGNMSVQIMASERHRFRSGHKLRARDAELRQALQSYESYFSSYKVDWEHGIIEHSVAGALFPNWTGTRQPRYFRFDGPDRLVLRTEPFDSSPRHRVIVTLAWDRLA